VLDVTGCELSDASTEHPTARRVKERRGVARIHHVLRRSGLGMPAMEENK
jgi:hypothetical protein